MLCYIPKHSSFCFGVDLAVKAAYENAKLEKDTYMYGEVVHNPVVVSDLLDKGLKLINDVSDITTNENDTQVLIRAHGVPESVIKELTDKGIRIIDKTCTRVKNVHEIVMDASSRDLDVIIVGTPNHPEVVGIVGWCKTNAVVVRDLEAVQQLIFQTTFPSKGVCVVAQTTHSKAKFDEICRYCETILPNAEIYDTICNVTALRQDEIRNLSPTVDCVIVVGGRKSSNVTKLYEIATKHCSKTLHIESATELNASYFLEVKKVLLASGASTPNSSIEEVIDWLKDFCQNSGQEFERVNLR